MIERWWEIARVFTRLGLISFGGPATSVAMMQFEVVERAGWMGQQEFLDLFAVTHIIPGPNAVEMAAHLGYRRGGIVGFLLGMGCFTLPAFLITLCLAIAYAHYGALPEVEPWLRGIKPAVLAVILVAVVRMARQGMATYGQVILGSVVVIASLAGLNEFYTVIAGTLLGVWLLPRMRRPVPFATRDDSQHRTVPGEDKQNGSEWEEREPRTPESRPTDAPRDSCDDSNGSAGGRHRGLWLWPPALGMWGAAAGSTLGLVAMFWFFFQVGCVMYGSGYVLLAYFRRGLVLPGFLSEPQLLDAVAVGQMTPGPLLTTATFIGYLLHGIPGAVLATLGIILPGVVLVALINRHVARLRRSPVTAVFLDAVTVASLGLMAAVAVRLSLATLTGPVTWLIALSAGAAHYRWKVSPLWIVIAGAAVGGVLGQFGWW